MREIVICSIAAALIAGAAVFYFAARNTAGALHLLKLGEAAIAESRALQACQHEDPAIAIWELRHLADLLNEHLDIGADSPRNLKLQLFMTHARLATLYARQQDQVGCAAHAEKALRLYRELHPTNEVADVNGLLELIHRLDDRATIEPRYE